MANYWDKKLEELEKEKGTSSQAYWDRKLAEVRNEEKKKKTKKDEDDDIAPVRTTTKSKKDEEEDDGLLDFFKKSSVFDDGWDAGDLTMSIVGTAGDAALNVAKGFGGVVEGVTDLAGYGAAYVGDKLGKNKWATDLRERTKESYVDKLTKPAEDVLDHYSILGRTSDAILQGVGQVGTIMATGGMASGLGKLGVTAVTSGLMGVSSTGSGMSEAYQNNATGKEAFRYGVAAGASDALFETFFGGMGKAINAVGFSTGLTSLDDIVAKGVSKFVKGKTGKNITEFLVKSGFEGLEEVGAGFTQAVAKKLTYMSEEEWDNILKDENLLEQFIVGAATSGVMQSGLVPGMNEGSLKEANKTGRDFISGLTDSEQKVIDRVVQDEIAQREKKGEKVSGKEKSKIYESVISDMDKGYISIDTIEEVLGGDTYATYKNRVSQEDALQKEFDDLNNKKKDDRTTLKSQLDNTIKSQLAGSRLQESYNERERAKQDYQIDYKSDIFKGTKHYDAAQKTIKSAIKAGANNTNRVHDIVDMAAKLSSDTGVVFNFKSYDDIKAEFIERQTKEIAKLEAITEPTAEQAEKLKSLKDHLTKVQSGAIKVNGVNTGKEIDISLDSVKALDRLVGHEVTHSLEKAKSYDALKKHILAYAKTKGMDIDSEIKSRSLTYEGVNKADPEGELVADLVGDFLFNDSEYIRNLATNDRNLFQRIYDEVKHLLSLATAGSKEARQLERVKHDFEKAYREVGAQKNTADSGSEYNINRTKTMSWGEQIQGALYNGKNIRRNDTLVVGNPADTSVATEIENKPLAIPLSVLTKASSGKDVSHSIKKGKLAKLDEGIKNAPITIVNPERNAVVYVTDIKQGGLPLIAAFDMNATFDGDEVHKATSIHLQVDVESMLKNLPESATVYVQKNELDPVGATNNLRGLSAKIKFIDDNVAQEEGNVKDSLSDSGGELVVDGDEVAKVLPSGSATKYSLSTWTPEMQEKVSKNLTKAGFEKKDVDKWIKDTNSIAAVIASDKARLDFEAADNQVMLKDNQEYIKTLDASTLCAKRLAYQGTFNAIQHRMPNTVLTSDMLIDLLNIMKSHKVQTPCGVCYVESRRRHLGKFAQQWLDSYEGEYKPRLDEITTSDGLEELRKTHPQAHDDFVAAMSKKGSSNPKVVQLRTEYRNEIMSLTPAQIRKIEAIGGLRVQSFSDFETPHLLDMMQAVMDMSAKGLHSQAYTKVPNFAWVFGDTGIKINLSLIAEGNGFDSNGNLAFSSTEGMDINEAMRLRDAYSKNVGTIIVGANDKHILACMADDRIDFIIPFHRSGWGMRELEMMGMDSYTDYTYGQKEHDLNKPTKVINGVQQYAGLENLYPPDYWNYELSGKENAERYLNLCAKLGREPKFAQFLVNNGDGSYSLQPDGSTDGYWKTLIDFKMYDNEGNGAAQQKVVPNFNMTEAHRVLNEYEGGANKLPVSNKVVEEFVAKYNSEVAPVQYSLSDSNGRQLSEEQQNFFKKSAIRDKNGSLMTLYHGTQNDFTVFDISRSGENYDGWSEFGEGIYLTPSKSSAEYYGDNAGWGREVNMMEVYADIKNPFNTQDPVDFDISDLIEKYELTEFDERFMKKAGYRLVDFLKHHKESVLDYLRSKGYDGVWEKDANGYVHQVVAYAENQVKNVDNTNPTEDPDIRYSLSDSSVAPVTSYAEIEEEIQKLRNREILLEERKRKAANDPELLQAMDDYSSLFTEVRGLLSKKKQGLASQVELDRIEEIKTLREERLKRVADLQESLGLNAIAEEEREIRETKESLRVASDEAWAREGAERENRAIEKAGVPASEYFRKKALKAFKTTTNFNEAGYLLPDGKLLNFSGGERNHRYRDHREIGEIYEATNGVAALNRFLNDGNIRIMAESPGIDLAAGVEPTAEQYAAIRKFIRSHGAQDERFFVDFSGTDGHRAGNYSYSGRVNADRVINDIKYYYANGETRQQSDIGRFLSISNEGHASRAMTNEDIAPIRRSEAFGSDFFKKAPPVEEDIAPVAISETETTTEESSVVQSAKPASGNQPAAQSGAVTSRIRQKITNAQTELNNVRQHLDQTVQDYDEEIANARAELEGKKNQNTKVAQALKKRIERLTRLKADIEADYNARTDRLEKRIERLSSQEYVRAEHRREKQSEYTKMWENLIGDTSTWKDMPLGLQYKTKTLRRILRNVVRNGSGLQDIKRADAIYDELETKYDHHEAQLKVESRKLKDTFKKMNLTHEEDTYAQMLGELRHNPETDLTEDVVRDYYNKHRKNIDSVKVDNAIAETRKLYDDLIVRVNEVLRQQGMKEIPYRQGYFPHFTNPKQNWLAKALNWKTIDTEIPTSIAGLTQDFKPQRSWQSFAQQRRGDTTDYSLYQGLDTYIHGALDWIYHIEDLQKRRALENYIRYVHSDEGVQKRIDEIKAQDYDADTAQEMINAVLAEHNNPLGNLVRELMNRTNTLANKKSSMDREMEEKFNRKVYSTMTNINNRVTANMVVGSLSSAMTNFIPMVQSWHQVSPVYTVRGLRDMIRSTIRDDGTIAKSDFLTNRLMEEENLYQTGWDKVIDKAAFMMDLVDNITAQTVWRSKYLQNLHDGMSEAQAIKDADQFAKNLIAGRSRGNAPTIFDAKNPFTKIFTAFQLEVANQYGYMFDDVPKDSKNDARLVKGYATAFLGAYVYNALYSALVGRNAAFDPLSIIEDLLKGMFGDDEEEPEDVLLDLGKNIVEEVPFVGGLLGGGRIPISSAIPYSGNSTPFETMLTDLSEGNLKDIGKELLKPLYYLALPVAGGQIKKTVEGLSMFSDEHPIAGSYTKSGKLRFPVEDNLGSKVQAALFGQYASKNARHYFDNDLAPLGDKQIQEYADSDMTFEDYHKYRNGLKDLKKQAEKVDYINGLDLTAKQKNVLKSYLFDEETYKEENPEKYAFLESEGIGYIGWKELDEEAKESWSWAFTHQDEYRYLKENGVNPEDYSVYRIPMLDFDDEGDAAYQWAYDNPEKASFGNAFTGGVKEYRKYASALSDIKSDEGQSNRKEKVINYLNELNIDYGLKMILLRSMYSSKSDKEAYNAEIVNYLINRDDISYDDMVAILKELDITVSNGVARWD